MLTAAEVAAVLRGYRFHFANEDDLQAAVVEALEANGIPWEREVRLSPRDRIDVLAGLPGAPRVGIEVKVAGTLDGLLAQLVRYAASDLVSEFVVVTSRAWRAAPVSVCRKNVEHVSLALTSAL